VTKRELQTIRDLRGKLAESTAREENQARIAHRTLKDANFMRDVSRALFNVSAAAEMLLNAGMPRGASYLLAAVQTIESEFNETRMAIVVRDAVGSPAGGDGNG
jgi:hypothetical protein